MNNSQLRIIKFAQSVGTFHGLFSFNFNTSTQKFQSSRKHKIFNILMKIVIASIFMVSLHILMKNSFGKGNLVIKLAQPISFATLLLLVLNNYFMFLSIRSSNSDVMDLLNNFLNVHKMVGLKNYSFVTSLFFSTFFVDLIAILINFIVCLMTSSLFAGFSLDYMIMINVFQSVKVICRYMTNVYIFAIISIGKFLENLNVRIEGSFDQSKDQHCKLGRDLDCFSIEYEKIIKLTKRIHGVFEAHLLFLFINSSCDIMNHVSKFFFCYL